MTTDPAALRGNWNYPTAMRFGVGRIAELPDACKSLGMKRPLLVTDPGLAKLPMVQDALASLGSAGLGAGLMARTIGMKRAKEIWLLCRQYDAATALDWGLVNAVVPVTDLEAETVRWCRDMLKLSPMALRMIKAGFNADTDGLAGIQELAGNATGLFYMSEEGQEGRNAWLERRPPNFGKYRKRP